MKGMGFPQVMWQTMKLRLTAFPAPTADLREPVWWDAVVGNPSDSRTSRPKIGELREEGIIDNGKLMLTINPGVINWIFTAWEKQEPFPSVGPFENSETVFSDLMFRWLGVSPPPLQRLAFGAELIEPVANKRAGYEKISQILQTVRVDPAGSSDFLYQINRPRTSSSGVEGLTINRLSKWAVIGVQPFRITVGQSLLQSISEEETFGCRLDLDINTAADFKGELPKDKLTLIWKELVKLAHEISSGGDVA